MLQDITENISHTYTPVAALIAYQTNNYGGNYYLETRKVKPDGSLGAAKPVSREFLTKVCEQFRIEQNSQPHGPIPGTLLLADTRTGYERYVWYNPPRKRKQFFIKNITLPEAEYPMPGVVYEVSGGTLSVFAYKGNGAPKPKSKMLYGPFFNYYESGRICLGTAKAEIPRDLTWEALLRYWENLFWNSENSHMMHNPMKEGKNLVLTLKESLETDSFDTGTLLATRMTLEQLLKRK